MSNAVYDRFEHAGVIVEIVQDQEAFAADPMENDNAGTLYSWHNWFRGDETIPEPDFGRYNDDTGEWEECSIAEHFADHYDAALTIPLFFADYGSSGTQIYESDDPNCALVFTEDEILTEWSGNLDGARAYAQARVSELDDYLQGNVFGIVVRERTDAETDPEDDDAGEVLESVWGFIGDPDGEYIQSSARTMAEDAGETVKREKAEALYWACADVVTVS